MIAAPQHLQFSLRTLLVLVTAVAIAAGAGPFLSLALVYAALIGSSIWARRALPVQVASQFAFDGQPKQFLPRSSYLTAMAFVGVWGPLLPAGLILLIAHQQLSPFMTRHIVWIACLLAAFVLEAHLLVVEANRRDPPRLPLPVWGVLLTFAAAVGWWVTALVYHHLP